MATPAKCPRCGTETDLPFHTCKGLDPESAMRQELWTHMDQDHNLPLLESELDDIVKIVRKVTEHDAERLNKLEKFLYANSDNYVSAPLVGDDTWELAFSDGATHRVHGKGATLRDAID